MEAIACEEKIVFSMLAGALLCSSLGSFCTVAGAAAANSDRAVKAQTEYQCLHPNEKFTLSDTDPEFAAMMQKYIYNDIYHQSVLAPRERYLVTLSVLTTAQNKKQLAAGATEDEVIGVITAMNPYVGFPRTLWMLKIANECFAARH